MQSTLYILAGITGDITVPPAGAGALALSLQGTPEAPFTVTVPDAADAGNPNGIAYYIINNQTGQDAFVKTFAGNPGYAPARRNTPLWIDSGNNAENL